MGGAQGSTDHSIDSALSVHRQMRSGDSYDDDMTCYYLEFDQATYPQTLALSGGMHEYYKIFEANEQDRPGSFVHFLRVDSPCPTSSITCSETYETVSSKLLEPTVVAK